MSAQEPMVRCERLLVGYREAILPPIDVAITPGRLVAVIGRNGSGKSTWFKTLLGLTPPVGGTVVRRPGLRVAYVPQVAALDPILPVRARDVVLWGRLRAWSFLRPFASRQDREIVERALVEADAASVADLPYAQLSEGQKQRVLFARMLATEAELVLCDEPTAAMDPVAERESYARLRRLAHERGMGVVVISHAVGAAARVADELLWMDRELGLVVHGPTDEVLTNPELVAQYGEVHAAREAA